MASVLTRNGHFHTDQQADISTGFLAILKVELTFNV
jgi:hypothetical protein